MASVFGVTDFNSQPHKEADHTADYRVYMAFYFNSQPHKEADEII